MPRLVRRGDTLARRCGPAFGARKTPHVAKPKRISTICHINPSIHQSQHVKYTSPFTHSQATTKVKKFLQTHTFLTQNASKVKKVSYTPITPLSLQLSFSFFQTIPKQERNPHVPGLSNSFKRTTSVAHLSIPRSPILAIHLSSFSIKEKHKETGKPREQEDQAVSALIE